jgi:DNA-binding Lrp family transcriptional regulator
MLANAWQRDFPLVPRPFARIAEQCARSEDDVLEEFRALQASGVIDRVGPVFRPHTVGASTLAAMAVPAGRLEAVAAIVGAHAGVNHSYEREHECNLWFVVNGASLASVQWTLACIKHATGLPVLRLPLVQEYHIDLGFDLDTGAAPRCRRQAAKLAESEKAFAARLAAGLPLVPRPYAALGDEDEVLEKLSRWLEAGVVRRIGAVVRHRKLGFEANAMVVWDAPDDEVAAAGTRLAADHAVTLCYRRARAAPAWPYNLYCMLHGRERARVMAHVERLSAGLDYPRAILFSRRCFVQRAPHYG